MAVDPAAQSPPRPHPRTAAEALGEATDRTPNLLDLGVCQRSERSVLNASSCGRPFDDPCLERPSDVRAHFLTLWGLAAFYAGVAMLLEYRARIRTAEVAA